MRFTLAILLTIAIACMLVYLYGRKEERWAVVYSHSADMQKLKSFDTVVLDADAHPPLAPLVQRGIMALGYISLGEADSHRHFYPFFAQHQLTLSGDPARNGHEVIDLRRYEWQHYVLDTVIPSILAQGFKGIMIDTLDSPIQAEINMPGMYSGMRGAAVDFIKSIRRRYPDMKIMVNRGFEILPLIAGDIDMVLAESTFSTYDAAAGKMVLLPQQERMQYLDRLRSLLQQSPRLKIYTLDYWPQEDRQGVWRIYAMQRGGGFIPYVSTMDLQKVYQGY